MRLDMYLKEKYNISRQKAQELIKKGLVSVGGRVVSKPAADIDDECEVSLGDTQSVLKYVGRGGYKLEGAIESFKISLEGKSCIDIGASTGGFTDCMLQNGAKRVIAVDVGTAQLDERLRTDSRVLSLENTDIREFDAEKYGRADFIGCDVSFISLTNIAEAIKNAMADDGEGVVLVKPQFEAGREHLNKNGIVKDIRVHRQVLKRVADCFKENGLYAEAAAVSPIKGGDGNIEYLLLISKRECRCELEGAISQAQALVGRK